MTDHAVIEIFKRVVSTSVMLLKPETHVERTRYFYICQLVATITELTFCSEKDPILLDRFEFSYIRYKEYTLEQLVATTNFSCKGINIFC